MILRGEVHRAALDEERTYLVLIVSADWSNETNWPYVVPIARAHGAADAPPYMLLTNEADPVTGVIFMEDLTSVDGGDLIERVGLISGATMAKVAAALVDKFDLRGVTG